MSTDHSLVFPTAIDLAGLDRDIRSAEAMIGGFAESAISRLGNLPAARIKIEGAGDADQLVGSLLPLTGKIQSAFASAINPLVGFAAQFQTNFNEVGATVERLSIRIDDAMRFPEFVKRVDSFRKIFLSRWGLTFKQAGDDVAKLGSRIEADAAKFTASIEKSAGDVKKAVAPIPGNIGYALESARHVDTKGAFSSYLKGLDEVSSEAIDKMKMMADAVANATGKGSRKRRSHARDQAFALDQTINAVPPRQNFTPAGRVPDPTAWNRLAKAGQIAGNVLKAAWEDLSRLSRQDARDIDRVISAWLGFKKVTAVMSTFGSVANATFQSVNKISNPKISVDPRQSVILRGVGSAAVATGSNFKSMADQVGMALGLFGFAFKAVNFFQSGTKGASDLNETVSKTHVILGNASASVEKFADEMASKFGLVKGTTLDAASSFAGLGRSLGRISGENLAQFSIGFTKLSADLSSFSNITMSAASDAIRTGLSGNQSDTLKELGVVLTETTTEQYAFAHGIAKAGTELNEQQKFMARSGLIMQGLSKVSGDLERTQNGAANQGRKLTGTIANLGTSIGSALLPAITSALQGLNEFATWATKAFLDNKAVFDGWTQSLLNGLDWVVAAAHNFPAVFEVARLKIGESLANIGAWFEVLGPNIVSIASYIGRNWLLLLGDAFEATITGLQNLWKNFQAIGTAIGEWFANGGSQKFQVDWTPMLEGFRATAEQFPALLRPALMDMSKEIAEAARPITGEVTMRREKRAMENGAAAQIADDPMADEALKGKNQKDKDKNKNKKSGNHDKNVNPFAGALELGSKEAYSSIVNATARRSGGMESIEKSGKDTAQNTAQLVKLMRDRQGKKEKPMGKLVIP